MWLIICTLQEEINSFACLVRSGFRFAFYWNAYSLIFIKLLFIIPEASLFLTTQKSWMSSANNLGFDAKFSDKLLIQIETISGPTTESLGTSVSNLPK